MWHTYVLMNVFRRPSLSRSSLVLGFRWQADCQSLRSVTAGEESDRQIKVELQCFMRTHNCCQTNGQWSTLLSMMQHSSVSNLWIWVIFFPRTLEFMQIAVDCFLCFCVQCIPTTFLKTLAHCMSSSLWNAIVPLTYNLYLQPIPKLRSLNIELKNVKK